jgi:hypothetical protein
MTSDNICFYLQNRQIQTSQTGGQWYSVTPPFSIPWLEIWQVIYCTPSGWIQTRELGIISRVFYLTFLFLIWKKLQIGLVINFKSNFSPKNGLSMFCCHLCETNLNNHCLLLPWLPYLEVHGNISSIDECNKWIR